MTFKDVIANDVHQTFINTEEFSEIHTINGKEMGCQVDVNEQIERQKRMTSVAEGIYNNSKLIYVAADDFGPLPTQGSLIRMDKKDYRVVDAVHEDGVYSITIEAAKGR